MQYDLCRHIKSNGLQCRAVALTDSPFCYFHKRLNNGHSLYRSTMVGKKSLMERGHIIALPPLEDRVSVQLALSEVINALACNFIDVQRANALLFGLRIAAFNARGLEAIDQPAEVVRDSSPAPGMLDSVAVDLAPPGLTCEIDDANDPAIHLNSGLAPGTYDQRTISATPAGCLMPDGPAVASEGIGKDDLPPQPFSLPERIPLPEPATLPTLHAGCPTHDGPTVLGGLPPLSSGAAAPPAGSPLAHVNVSIHVFD
jgi:hypothetical protein